MDKKEEIKRLKKEKIMKKFIGNLAVKNMWKILLLPIEKKI